MATQEVEIIPQDNSIATRYSKKHSPELRAEAIKLAESGISPTSIARKFNLPIPTVFYWIEAASRSESLENPINLANKFERAAHMFISLAIRRAKKASFAHLMTGAGIAVDKMQLLRGQPTSIHEERTIDSRQVLVLLQESIGEPSPTPLVALTQGDTES